MTRNKERDTRKAPGARTPGARALPAGANLWLLARHDFRQPAQTLELLAQGLARAATEADRRRYATAIAQVASTLADMVAGMSMVARLEAGEARPLLTEVPLAEASATAAAGLAAALGQARARLVERRIEGHVLADADLIAAMLRGILLYAVKFCESDRIDMQTRRDGANLEIVLTFAGRHHDTAMTDGAFVELPPEDPDGTKPHVGLGPALCARIAAQLGGALRLDETADGLARITLALQAAEPAPPLANQRPTA